MRLQDSPIKLYCGGTFPFDYLNPDYRENAKQDYRAELLGSVHLLLEKHSYVPVNGRVHYTGPFYFESDGMDAQNIVETELEMIRNCTHAIFLMNEGNCPGTITELILASTLKKYVQVFYVKKSEAEETESSLHSPCWFAILASQLLNPNTSITACENEKDAKNRIFHYVHVSLLQPLDSLADFQGSH